MIFEVCVDSVESAINGELGGADALVAGYLTPEGCLVFTLPKTLYPSNVIMQIFCKFTFLH